MTSSVWGKYFSTPFQLSHSVDGGRTWSDPLQRPGWIDAARSIVDNSGSEFDGRLYVFSNRFSLASRPHYEPLLVSEDGGNSLRAPQVTRTGSEYLDPGWPGQAVVLSDGTVVAAYTALYRARVGKDGVKQPTEHYGIEVVSSSDGGKSLSKPTVVNAWERDRRKKAGLQEQYGIFNLSVALAVDTSQGTYGDRIYLAWRHASDSSPRSEIMVSWSTDKGVTWSQPARVDDVPSDASREQVCGAEAGRGIDPMLPSVAVNKDGVVGLMWMECLADPAWRFSASVDGGATFTSSELVYGARTEDAFSSTAWIDLYASGADRPSDPRNFYATEWDKAGFTIYTQFGQSGALTSTIDGVFHPTWNTRSDGALWTRRIKVGGQSRERLATVLEKVADVTARVRLEAQGFLYSAESGAVFVDVTLLNTSLGGIPERDPNMVDPEAARIALVDSGRVCPRQTLFAPMIVRLNSVSSELGSLTLVNADGFDDRGRPLLDWSSYIDEGLGPNQRSRSRRLEFRLVRIRPTSDVNIIRVANVEATVYAAN